MQTTCQHHQQKRTGKRRLDQMTTVMREEGQDTEMINITKARESLVKEDPHQPGKIIATRIDNPPKKE